MALLIFILIVLALLGLARKGRAVRKQNSESLTSEQQKRRKEADELITVILPTINQDK